ncbi:hypothetical protein KOW79_015999 [Hemibagrus wyckioides]|uniref:Uncharacterized protein n=1 Tax=Hemibagrus wyckioides TaxID=337641 RepID=A0A9D3NCD6_9TELE|nr:hypothetical protein KOW79_015999 [Hemibagrus wyckioides]
MILRAGCESSRPISERLFVTQRRLSGFVWVLKSLHSGRREIGSDSVRKRSAVLPFSLYPLEKNKLEIKRCEGLSRRSMFKR